MVTCLVEVPATYKTITKQERVGCAAGYMDEGNDCVRKVDVPAEYGTRRMKVIKTPATTREIEIPAE